MAKSKTSNVQWEKKILPILWIVNAIIIINRRFFFNDLTPGTRTSHGWTEEDINEQHDGEKDSKSNTKPHQPIWVSRTESGTVYGRSWKKNEKWKIKVFEIMGIAMLNITKFIRKSISNFLTWKLVHYSPLNKNCFVNAKRIQNCWYIITYLL